MRFHIGFSKRISIKKIIEILGFLFVVFIMATSCNKVLAWDNITYDNFYNIETDSYDRDNYFNPYSSSTARVVSSSATDYGLPINSNDDYYVSAITDESSSIHLLTQDRKYYFTNTFGADYQPSCNTLDSSTKSIDFKFGLRTTYTADTNLLLTNFNQNENSTLFNVFMYAIDETKDITFSTPCTLDLKVWNGNYSAYFNNITCSNVFSGNNKYTIDSYAIVVENAIPFNDRYLASNVVPSVNGIQQIENGDYNFSYQCNNDTPIVEGGFPSDDDPAGLNDIYNKILDNFDNDIGGITINQPMLYSDLISLPFSIINAVISSSNSTCTPFRIDFSSIASKWGSPNSSYVLELPCMRSTLTNILGSTTYNLVDLLICFYLFYNIAMFIVRSVSAITSGKDLFEFYFQNSESNSSMKGG